MPPAHTVTAVFLRFLRKFLPTLHAERLSDVSKFIFASLTDKTSEWADRPVTDRTSARIENIRQCPQKCSLHMFPIPLSQQVSRYTASGLTHTPYTGINSLIRSAKPVYRLFWKLLSTISSMVRRLPRIVTQFLARVTPV